MLIKKALSEPLP